ncbi:MAG: peptidase M23, partial [Butyrivibrio sp.]|nr:peptidase M23 [Butyrivibrio sp.]
MSFSNTVFRRKIKVWFLQSTLVIIVAWILFMPSFVKFEKGGDNIFTVKLNDVVVGIAGSEEEAYEAYRDARRSIASSDGELVLAKADLNIEGSNVLWGTVDSVSSMSKEMSTVLKGNLRSTLNRSYSIKINEFAVNLASTDDVMKLLSTALSNYDEEGLYDV